MLTLVVLFVQVFVLNNLSISPLVAPMVYIVLLLLMPIESSQWKMLGVGLLLGLVMDVTMGTAGLNTIVTLPIALARHRLLYLFAGLSPMSKEEGIPSIKRLGIRFHRYLSLWLRSTRYSSIWSSGCRSTTLELWCCASCAAHSPRCSSTTLS